MKYVIVLGDGMADNYIDEIKGTPLSAAEKRYADKLAETAEIGLVKTIPDGFKPASDVANLSVLGYDPESSYSGRSPLEALSIGIDMEDIDVAVRCNLVTLSNDEPFENKTMLDYGAGEISTAEAEILIKYIREKLGSGDMLFYAGVSYRHCLIIKNGKTDIVLTPPHDITGQKIGGYLPKGRYGDAFTAMYREAFRLLSTHPVNIERVRAGKNPANCIWLWGAGTKPRLQSFYEKTGLRGAVISAVDLLKGIGKAADMQVIDVAGATGNFDTDYRGKALAALNALKNNDFCYIHIEAPDECGHRGELENKIASIEKIDSETLGTVVDGLNAAREDFALLFLPDHPTPVALKTHTDAPVPYLMYSSRKKLGENSGFDENTAKAGGIFYPNARLLIKDFLKL